MGIDPIRSFRARTTPRIALEPTPPLESLSTRSSLASARVRSRLARINEDECARAHMFTFTSFHTPRRARASPRLAAPSTMEVADVVAKPMRDFAKDSVRLVKKCTKPDAREFWKIASRTATGFVVMGFVGFFVKLIFVPINQIILSS